jgi:hypothetical protein
VGSVTVAASLNSVLAVDEHEVLVGGTIAAYHGEVVKSTGDGPAPSSRRRRESNPRRRFCRPLPVPLGYAAGNIEVIGSAFRGRADGSLDGGEDRVTGPQRGEGR